MPDLPASYADVLDALPRVRSALQTTPTFEWPGLSELLGCRYFAKHENHQPVGAFKIRGGINLVSTLSDTERAAGILGCSTGNHGQSLAWAAKRFGVNCTIVVPAVNNPGKCAGIRRLGATLIGHGQDFDEARDYAERELAPTGLRYVHSANEPTLVIGVQAEGAPAVAESWRAGEMRTTDSINTFAEGVATRVPAQMTLDIMHELLDDVVLVSDDEMRQAVYWLLEHTHNLAAAAGAASLAAAYKIRGRFTGKTVDGVISGGNLDLAQLPQILSLGGS